MRKHIIGLVLFSFIVSAAAIGYSFFYVPSKISSSTLKYETSLYIPEERTHCKVKRELNQSEIGSPIVTQAVYSVKTRKLSWKVLSLGFDYPTVLHLFLENEKGIQRVDAFYVRELSGDEELNAYSELGKMLNQLSPKTNLYVMADTKFAYLMTDELHSPFKFDSSRAFPVTIDYGK